MILYVLVLVVRRKRSRQVLKLFQYVEDQGGENYITDPVPLFSTSFNLFEIIYGQPFIFFIGGLKW